VVSEQLSMNETLIFSRDGQSFATVPAQLSPLIDNVRKNQLLLYFAQQNNEEHAKAVYRWFVEDLIFVNTDQIGNDCFKVLQDEKFKRVWH